MASMKVDGSKVVKMKVPASTIREAGVDITEFGYFPNGKIKVPTTKELEDIWNEANK
jgi:hypothetical protein